MKNMSRAMRRHHAARLKQSRRFYFGRDNRAHPRELGMLVDTPTPCSCFMCGNARANNGRTLPERRHLVQLVEEI